MTRFLSGVLCVILCLVLLSSCTVDKPTAPAEDDGKDTTVPVPTDTDSREAQDTENVSDAEGSADTGEAGDTASTDETDDTADTGESTDTADTSDAADIDDTSDTADTEDVKDIEVPEEPEIVIPEFSEDEIAASLVGVRQGMVGTPTMMTAAYLGFTDSMESVDPLTWIYGLLPGFISDLPFITAIDDSRIIGDRYGEAYLIVPCDENASVCVNRVDEGGEVTEVLYRSDYGDPVILFANNTGNYSLTDPDVQIGIVDSEGKTLTWYPTLNDRYYLSQPSDASVADLTPYAETLTRDYSEFLGHGWQKPDRTALIDTSWDAAHYLADGSSTDYHINFTGDSVYMQWGEGSLTAAWELASEDGICMLKVNPNTDNERSYLLLLGEDNRYLYLSQDFVNGTARSDELISVMMERTYG